MLGLLEQAPNIPKANKLLCRQISAGDEFTVVYSDGSSQDLSCIGSSLGGLGLSETTTRSPIFQEPGQQTLIYIGGAVMAEGIIIPETILRGASMQMRREGEETKYTLQVADVKCFPGGSGIQQGLNIYNYNVGRELQNIPPIPEHQDMLKFIDKIFQKYATQDEVGYELVGSSYKDIQISDTVHLYIKVGGTHGMEVCVWDEETGDWHYANYFTIDGGDVLKIAYANTIGTGIEDIVTNLRYYGDPSAINRANIDVFTQVTSEQMQINAMHFKPGASTIQAVWESRFDAAEGFYPGYVIQGQMVQLHPELFYWGFAENYPEEAQQMHDGMKLTEKDGTRRLILSDQHNGVGVPDLHKIFKEFCTEKLPLLTA